ncbi:MAG: aminopeptidase P family protein [Planctomycetota bacterium]|nr:MAG: aminopeptidase P family protein [Planctomycetota bacterium]
MNKGFSANTFARRRRKLQQQLDGADAFLIVGPSNVRYLTGFTGDSTYLLLDKSQCWMLSDPRYEVQIAEQCPNVPLLLRKPNETIPEFAAQQLLELGMQRVRVEFHLLSVRASLVFGDIELIDAEQAVERLRMIKDADELSILERAVAIAEHAMEAVLPVLHSRLSERQVAHELERLMRSLGATGCSFPPIVAVGARAALPHAEPGETTLGAHGLLLIDWGATYMGYRSDLTRVFATSRIPAKLARAYEAVAAAKSEAIEAMKPGVATGEVDDVVRRVLREYRLESRFNHGLGHGLGLDIHEGPRMGRGATATLEPGMVVTVEPGVYFPGLGGIRIEDDVLITDSGAHVLSRLPRSLDENRRTLLA